MVQGQFLDRFKVVIRPLEFVAYEILLMFL